MSVSARWRTPLTLIIGCLLYVTMALRGVAHESGTFDEFVHVTAGYSYWAFNDYRLNPENGNLAQRIIALPLVLSADSSVAFPTRDQRAWHVADEWALSDQYFFGPRRNADAILFRGRAMVSIVAALLGVLVFFWSRSLFGTWGGYISFALYVFSPTMLAHGALATSDLIGTAFFAAAMWSLWVTLHRVTPMTLTLSLLAVGGLFVAKPSAPLIVPIGLAMIAVQLMSKHPIAVRLRRERLFVSRKSRAGVAGLLVLLHIVAAWIVIWAAYGFRYSALAPGSPATDTLMEPWSRVLEHGGAGTSALAQWGRVHHILPEAYLYGFAVVVEYSKARMGFVNGVFTLAGNRSFFMYTTLYKTTLPGLILVACAGIALLAGLRRLRWERASSDWTPPFYQLTPILLGVLIYGGTAVLSSLNIGHRHLLPIIPLAMILAGAVAPALASATRELPRLRQSLPAAGVALLLVWHAVASIMVAPHYLAYFNELAGGPSNGFRHLVDSSLDWGQDLPGLKTWLDREGLQGPNHPPIYLSYFGTSAPRYYGIDAMMLPGFPDRVPARKPQPLAPGVYCFSATMLQGVYFKRPGRWIDQYEGEYRQATRDVAAYDSVFTDPAARQALVSSKGQEFWLNTFNSYEHLRAARLAAYLRRRDPDAQIGHSILIYRVSEQDLKIGVGEPQPR